MNDRLRMVINAFVCALITIGVWALIFLCIYRDQAFTHWKVVLFFVLAGLVHLPSITWLFWATLWLEHWHRKKKEDE